MTTAPLSWRAGLLLLALVLGFLPRPSSACQLDTPSQLISFGTQSSLAAGVSAQSARAVPNAGISCPATALTVLPGGFFINATVSSANDLRLRHASGDSIAYAAYPSDNPQAPALTPGAPFNYYNSGFLQTGSGWVNVPMTFRVPAAAGNLSAGTYTDTLTIVWRWSVCREIGLGGLCLGAPRTGNATSVINLTLTIAPDCIVQAPDVDFGSAPLISGFEPVTQTLLVRCTKGQSFSVGIDNGQHAAGGQRRMAAGGDYLAYEIFQGPASTTRWGNSGGARRASTSAETNPGAGTGITAQGFIYRAEILTDQATPPPGAYSDTLVVDIAF
ncbi:Csu type fimbrial protein [Salinicola aestuarinus]|uniref:Csu type fimbrial protein n=1 Tax=Salinicola aestuarinus TaxID=1949082 RepID=UPI000DA1BEFF|nr:spore coat U domain-containing protein [Salinicola aestuarinus]